MTHRRTWLAALVALALCGGALASRPFSRLQDPDPARFLADARAGTRRYQSQQSAIDDGFRRVGAEFPAMGEHWVSFERVMEDSLDAARPSVLIYISTPAGPRLAGVAWSRLLEPGRAAPSFPFAGAWHQHNGAIADESLPMAHGAHDAHVADPSTSSGNSPHFFILHGWVWTANPDGPFATDNWALPLVRDSVSAAPDAPRDAVRALALADDGEEYHRTVITRSLALDTSADSAVATVLSARRAAIELEAAPVRAAHRLSPAAAQRLAAAWDSTWSDLARVLPSRARDLEGLRARM